MDAVKSNGIWTETTSTPKSQYQFTKSRSASITNIERFSHLNEQDEWVTSTAHYKVHKIMQRDKTKIT